MMHLLGTDALGRDILSRLLEGARTSVAVGFLVGMLAAAVGTPIGLVAAYCGNPLDDLLMRAMDVLLALPGILLAVGIVAALGPGLTNVMLAVGIVSLPSFARVARASTLHAKEMPYVEAALNLGAGSSRIIVSHLLPNVASPLIVLFSLRVATAILTAASLGFLGLGAQPPQPEWGAMLSDGKAYLTSAPHVATAPGLAIMVVVLGFNLFGDGLRDALDPHLKESRETR
jgi:peptide/nickel transport system permease protein